MKKYYIFDPEELFDKFSELKKAEALSNPSGRLCSLGEYLVRYINHETDLSYFKDEEINGFNPRAEVSKLDLSNLKNEIALIIYQLVSQTKDYYPVDSNKGIDHLIGPASARKLHDCKLSDYFYSSKINFKKINSIVDLCLSYNEIIFGEFVDAVIDASLTFDCNNKTSARRLFGTFGADVEKYEKILNGKYKYLITKPKIEVNNGPIRR